MANEEKPADLAKRAGRQGKNAAKNGIKAVQAAAEPVIEATVEEIHDNAEKLEGTAEDAVQAVRGFDRNQAMYLVKNGTIGAIALSVSAYAALFAYGQFRRIRGFNQGYTEAMVEATVAEN